MYIVTTSYFLLFSSTSSFALTYSVIIVLTSPGWRTVPFLRERTDLFKHCFIARQNISHKNQKKKKPYIKIMHNNAQLRPNARTISWIYVPYFKFVSQHNAFTRHYWIEMWLQGYSVALDEVRGLNSPTHLLLASRNSGSTRADTEYRIVISGGW